MLRIGHMIAMKVLLLLLTLGSVKGADAKHSEQARIQGYLNKWQVRLGMQDWTVHMTVLSADEIGDALAGWSRTDPETKTLTMLISRAADYPRLNHSVLLEQENTVVHELIHALIRYQSVVTDKARNEWVTNELANALVPLVGKQ
jgi:hypothetical protein